MSSAKVLPGPKSDLANDILLEGQLYKFSTGRGAFTRKNWKKRYVIVGKDKLSYSDDKGSKVKGSIPWTAVRFFYPNVQNDINPNATDKNAHYFAVHFDDGKDDNVPLLLRASDAGQRSLWTEAIAEALQPYSPNLVQQELMDEEDAEPEPSLKRIGSCRRARGLSHKNSNTGADFEIPLVEEESEMGSPRETASPTGTSSTSSFGGKSKLPPATGSVAGGADSGMTSLLKGIVSKNKLRYQKDGFDLDLSYISPNFIAMGFPSAGREALYRNAYEEVYKFMKFYHDRHYKVYNLCSEREYDETHFEGNFVRFGFDDHNPPWIGLFLPFCENVSAFLKQDMDNNVVAVHCKAGKGRTGTMISAAYMYMDLAKTADEALNIFSAARTKDSKGVTIPSQIRYVHYFEYLKACDYEMPEEKSINITSIELHTTPHFDVDGGCDPYFVIWQRDLVKKEDVKEVFDSRSQGQTTHCKSNEKRIPLALKTPVPVQGDVKVCFFDYDAWGGNDPMFHFWFNTAFVDTNVLTLRKADLDEACKDKSNTYFDETFKITLIFDLDG